MPSDMPIYSAGLTSGKACRKTAGTAIYEALAASTINSTVSPKGRPNNLHKPSAIEACNKGARIA